MALEGQAWCTPLVPALGSRGKWISKLKASLVYSTARATQRNPISEIKKKKKKKKGH